MEERRCFISALQNYKVKKGGGGNCGFQIILFFPCSRCYGKVQLAPDPIISGTFLFHPSSKKLRATHRVFPTPFCSHINTAR